MTGDTTTFTAHAYRGAADLAAMQAALAGWIHSAGDCGYCHVGDTPHRLYNGMRGRYPLDALVRLWWQGDTLAGFALSYPTDTGFDAFLSPEARGGDLERAMLDWGYTTTRAWLDLKDQPDEPVFTDAFACDSTRIRLLLELGYTAEDAPWLAINERGLSGDLPPVTLPEGYMIRSAAGDADAAQLAAVHAGAFDSDWTPDLYRDEVMHRPGYDVERERVVVAPDGRFAAFCIVWLDERNRVGLFEPVGTHADFQRMGLGRALMADGLRFMRERGMERAQVGSEADNPASSGLYAAMGFAPKHHITGYFRK